MTFHLTSSCPLSSTCPGMQKTDMLEQLRNIKNPKKPKKPKEEKKPKLTSGVISVDSEGFQELKARVIKLRAEQLDLLGERGVIRDEISVENPADIIPSCLKKPFSCEKCGKGYKTKRGLEKHNSLGSKCYVPSGPASEIIGTPSSEQIALAAASGPGSETINTPSSEQINLAAKPVEFKCDNCGEVFARKSGLKRHILQNQTCNKIRELKETGQYVKEDLLEGKQASKLFECDGCHKEFKTITGLKVHARKCLAKMEAQKKLISTESGHLDGVEAEQFEMEKTPELSELEELDLVNQELELPCPKEVDIAEKREILVAYFDTLVNTGRSRAALEEFKYIKSNEDGKDYVESIVIYDKLLRGFARNNDFGKIQELWKEIVSSGQKPTMDSFVSAMISFHKVDGSKNVFKTIFNQVYDDFTQAGFTVEHAIYKGNFLFDDKDRFLSVISSFLPPSALPAPSQESTATPIVRSLNSVRPALKSQVETVMAREELEPLLARQLEMETRQTVQIPSIFSTHNSDNFREFTRHLQEVWRGQVYEALEYKISSRKKLPLWLRGSTINMHQFLTCVSVEQLTDIIMSTAKENLISDNFSMSVPRIISKLGTDVMLAYHTNLKTSDASNNFSNYLSAVSKYHDWYCSPDPSTPSHRAAIQSVTKDLALEQGYTMWPKSVRTAVGTEMYRILTKEIVVDRDREGSVISDGKVIDSHGILRDPVQPASTCPAFFKVFRKRRNHQDMEELKPHPSISAVFQPIAFVDLEFPATDLPMLVPPLPWVSHNTGAYYIHESKLVKNHEAAQAENDALLSSLPPGGLNPVLDSINQLSSVPWIVNKPVLELACKLFLDQSDKQLLSQTDLPLHPDMLPTPTLPDGLHDVIAGRTRLTDAQAEEYRNFIHLKSIHAQMKSETFSLWCTALYRLSLANHFQDNILWFPHNIDFRGRCYPLPSQLNHMGADMARSLLIFAKGKKLGKHGFTWLKLHCINLTGTMKRESVAARLEYVDSIMPKIIESATSPLDGERWWLESDDPWQTFSACVEIKRALDHPGGPEDYTCHLPIHQDGSCNGLQHYAAMGRDKLGARAVNLVPSDKPQDVYSEIAAIVDRKRGEDSQAGLEIATALEGFIKRKVVKQTVMTTVYGVTKYGATQQIAKQLKNTEDFPVALVDQASKYLSNKTFESLNEMFTASQEIQSWFTECAKIISKDCQSNVTWVTPLGFPVIQPYSSMYEKVDKTISLDMTSMFKVGRRMPKEMEVKINTIKNRNGFAPNFVHSLDSSHMMLTSMALWSQGITFASVHDCFWTHASDVETMNRACRDQFIALHSSPILEDLSQHFMEKYMTLPDNVSGKQLKPETLDKLLQARNMEERKREMLFTSLPRKGELDLSVVNESVYFFS